MPAETPAATARVRSDFDRIAALPDDPCDHDVRHHEPALRSPRPLRGKP